MLKVDYTMRVQEGLYVQNRTILFYAVSSRCDEEGNDHVLFWDFDNVDLDIVLRSLSKVQNYHGLGDIYILQSMHGYNAFCLDKIYFNEAYNILFNTKFNDYNHIKIGRLSESWCLKLTENKQIIKRLIPTENYDMRKQSLAHYELFKKFYDYNNLRILYPDLNECIEIESYKQNVI